MSRLAACALTALLFGHLGCEEADPVRVDPSDGGLDAGGPFPDRDVSWTDADAVADVEIVVDAGMDAEPDAWADAGMGAEPDAGSDAGTNAAADAGPDPEPPQITSAPVLVVEPNETTGLVASLALTTDIPTRLSVELEADGERWVVEFEELTTAHDVVLLDLRPGAEHRVTALVSAADLTTRAEPVVGTTRSLDPRLPVLSTATSEPELMEPGVTLFNIGSVVRTEGFLVIVDHAGQVVWYHHDADRPSDARRLQSGRLLYIRARTRVNVVEIDMLGNERARWRATGVVGEEDGAISVATDSFHHEVIETVGETFVALSSAPIQLAGYPTSAEDPTPREGDSTVVSDVIVEFDRAGAVLGEWTLIDVLDPLRVNYDAFSPFWDRFYPELTPTIDWSHANAVVVDPVDDALIVSMRSQDAILKLRRNGEIAWLLGTHEAWSAPWSSHLLEPVGEGFRWFHAQHSPQRTALGTLMVYDNANHEAWGAAPERPGTFSRAVEYSVDEENAQVRQVWEHVFHGELNHTPITGDADMLPVTHNVLITQASRQPQEDGIASAVITEVTHETPARVVFELRVEDDNPNGPGIRGGYRAERLPTLYP